MGLKVKHSKRSNHGKEEALKDIKTEPTIRFNFDVPLSLHRKFKMKVVSEGLTMQDVLRKFLEDYIKH